MGKIIPTGWWFQPSPLKNGVRQLGWWHSQVNGKIKCMFQTTNQDIWLSLRQSNMEMDTSPFLDDSSHSTSISCQFEDGNAATVGSRAKHHPSARFRPSFPSNKNSLLENAFHTMDDHNPQIWWYVLGGWPTPLKNMSSSVRMIIPNIWKNEKCSKPPTRIIQYNCVQLPVLTNRHHFWCLYRLHNGFIGWFTNLKWLVEFILKHIAN